MTATAAHQVRARACAALGDLTNSQPEGVAFDAGASALQARVGAAIAGTLDARDEVIVVVPARQRADATWTALAAEHDLLVREASIEPGVTAKAYVAAVHQQISTRTRVLVFDLGSPARGIAPARALARLAHQEGALAWSDGTELLADRRFDRQRQWVDVLFADLARMGLAELGAVAMRPDLARDLPLPAGGRDDASGDYGRRFEAGTVAEAELVGAADGLARHIDVLDRASAQ